jgi:hypothetical protein
MFPDEKVVDSKRSCEDLEDFMKLTEDQSTIDAEFFPFSSV